MSANQGISVFVMTYNGWDIYRTGHNYFTIHSHTGERYSIGGEWKLREFMSARAWDGTRS